MGAGEDGAGEASFGAETGVCGTGDGVREGAGVAATGAGVAATGSRRRSDRSGRRSDRSGRRSGRAGVMPGGGVKLSELQAERRTQDKSENVQRSLHCTEGSLLAHHDLHV